MAIILLLKTVLFLSVLTVSVCTPLDNVGQKAKEEQSDEIESFRGLRYTSDLVVSSEKGQDRGDGFDLRKLNTVEIVSLVFIVISCLLFFILILKCCLSFFC